jgi:hypothetical protein
MQAKKLSQETIAKIEKCIFNLGKTCEVKIEHGQPTVIAIQRNVIRDEIPSSKGQGNK